MSRSAMPAFLRAAITLFIWTALALIAPAAVAPSVWTPRVMVAKSGVTLLSPEADRFSVVARNAASAVSAWAGRAAPAVSRAPARAIEAVRVIRAVIVVVLQAAEGRRRDLDRLVRRPRQALP